MVEADFQTLLKFVKLLNTMRLYQIAELEQLTGIKAHTIRIWENGITLLNPIERLATIEDTMTIR